VCEYDDWFADGPDHIEFERHHTMVEVSDCCDFLYRRVAPNP
jgi:hypothetical protein